MAKVDKSHVQAVYERLQHAKEASFAAEEALHETAEYKAAQDARQKLELAEDCLAGLQMIISGKVI